MIAGLLPPRARARSSSAGADITTGNRAETKAAALQIQMYLPGPDVVAQPAERVRDIISEAPVYHGLVKQSDAPRVRGAQTLERVGTLPNLIDISPCLDPSAWRPLSAPVLGRSSRAAHSSSPARWRSVRSS